MKQSLRISLTVAIHCIFFLLPAVLRAQDSVHSPVHWSFGIESAPAGTGSGPYVVIFHARIDSGWKLYSTTMPDDLPNSRVATDSASRVVLKGIEEKGKLETTKDPLFDHAETRYFRDQLDLLVKIQRAGATAPLKDIEGKVVYMAIKGDSVVGPLEEPFRYGIQPDGSLTAKSAALQQSAEEARSLTKSSINLANPVNKCGGTGTEGSKGLLGIFLLGILGGLVALVMPCTFPMIPLTVSFFTKSSGNRSKGVANAFLYGFFIFLIYVLISVPFYFLKANNANILNNISTNIWLNIAFAAIFLVFALSFFGLFEITLPSSISNKVDAKSSIGSLGGIFFMALTLVIVSFSCTGPILGSLLVGAFDQNGGAIQLTIAMAGFGLALGLPFALFALFPNWLHSLPRSGGWMNTVKIVFGFIELALALKYFSNADLVIHWGLLKRETFFALWIVIDIALVLYLFGILRFKHDPPPARLTRTRIGFGILFLAFGIYLVPGLTNTRFANLTLISGFPPPLSYSWYGSKLADGKGVEADVINDYEKALALARQQHKPVLIDFTGWACQNCRRMEEQVWPQQEVKDLISRNYILVSLYVDDRELLPDGKQFLFTAKDGSQKPIRTIGDKFATLQSENFKSASQPLYVLISPDEQLLTRPVAYTPDPKKYAAWLQCGLDAFRRAEVSVK